MHRKPSSFLDYFYRGRHRPRGLRRFYRLPALIVVIAVAMAVFSAVASPASAALPATTVALFIPASSGKNPPAGLQDAYGDAGSVRPAPSGTTSGGSLADDFAAEAGSRHLHSLASYRAAARRRRRRVSNDTVAVEPVVIARPVPKARSRPHSKPQAASQQGQQSPPPPVSAPQGSPQQIAAAMLSTYGWGADQMSCLVPLWNTESGWRYDAANPSGAYGIPQALPGSKMASAGADWQTDPATQIRWGLGYIQSSYGTPCGAWAHEQSAGWY